MRVRTPHRRVPRPSGFAGLVAVAALLISATPAWAAAGDASAFGVKLDLSLLGSRATSVGPFAAAHSEDGPFTSTFKTVDVPGALSTGVLTTDSARDERSGGLAARASVVDVRVDLLAALTGSWSAEAVEAECSSTQDGLTGSARLVGLDAGTLRTPATEPAANTTVDVGALGVTVAELVLNEQVRNADGSLTVNALRLRLLDGVVGSLGSGDLVISSTTCGAAALPVPLASGAGLWIGVGALALVVLPVSYAATRRRAPEVV
ncbi:choice-of-anchor P family protein [Actinosynnema mirum]|uniref:Secreted protein n=1 Tax=Actinosynnema mirum (strain ATCC 29888 / DSM 43827 / JCM 3225 / NBRC 14064 / NCIMB 13271 / NRRL B-12336 / IMRU 3971 / 101) TaxID=446462 RepID=C6WNN6_ACTMD|nr:choice-of-anchor P family protein [Actinosynnema mirum]ACU34955.1 hypothetical protein Amir_0999 [Actinosynnema mirum DSM 43827]